MEIKGKITQIPPIQTGMGKKGAWAKSEFILETQGQYPKKVAMSLWGQDKIDKYDLEVGLTITAHIELESKDFNGRWYTEIRAWKIEWDKSQQRKWEPAGESMPQHVPDNDTPPW